MCVCALADMIMCRQSYAREMVSFERKVFHLQHFCKVCTMENVLPEVLIQIRVHPASAMPHKKLCTIVEKLNDNGT